MEEEGDIGCNDDGNKEGCIGEKGYEGRGIGGLRILKDAYGLTF